MFYVPPRLDHAAANFVMWRIVTDPEQAILGVISNGLVQIVGIVIFSFFKPK